MVAKKHIMSVSSYKDKNGDDKSFWMRIGELFESNGKQYVKLYINPDTLYHVFEPREDGENDRQASDGPVPF